MLPPCQKVKFVLEQECAQDHGDVLGTENGQLEPVEPHKSFILGLYRRPAVFRSHESFFLQVLIIHFRFREHPRGPEHILYQKHFSPSDTRGAPGMLHADWI